MVVAPILASCPCPALIQVNSLVLILTNCTRWNMSVEVSNSANSLSKWRFHHRRRCRSWLSSLLWDQVGKQEGVMVLIHSYTTFHLLVYYLYLKTNSSRLASSVTVRMISYDSNYTSGFNTCHAINCAWFFRCRERSLCLSTQNFNLLETTVVVIANRKTWFVNLLSRCRINDHFYKSRTLSMTGLIFTCKILALRSRLCLVLAVRQASVLKRGRKTNNYFAASITQGLGILIP